MNNNYHCLLRDRISYDEAVILWQSCDDRNVYNHPGCWRALEESGVRRGQVISVEVRSPADELVGIWPFVLKRGGIKALFLHVAEPIGSRRLDYVLPLVRMHEKQEILSCLMLGVKEVLNKCSRMTIPKLIKGEAYTEACGKLAALAFVSSSSVQCSPRMFFGKSYAETEALLGWGKKHKPSTRIRRLQKEGNVTLWIAQSRQEVLDRLPILFKLHQEKWHAEGKPSQFDSARDKELFVSFARYLPENLVHYSELRLNDDLLSCHFGFFNSGWVYWYKPAYDRDYEKFSPGAVHIALLAQHGVERGWQGIDFLQGDESYKYRWANNSLEATYMTIATKLGYPWWFWETYIRGDVRRFVSRPLRFVLTNLKRKAYASKHVPHDKGRAS